MISSRHNMTIERFAAFLDGNLSDTEMNRTERLISESEDLQNIVTMSDIIDEDESWYTVDDNELDSEIEMMENNGIDIPQIEDLAMTDDIDDFAEIINVSSEDLNDIIFGTQPDDLYDGLDDFQTNEDDLGLSL